MSEPRDIETDLLLSAIRDLSFARDLETVTFVVRAIARALTGADGVTFVLREGDQCHYVDEDAIAPLWKGKRFPLESCISGWSMLNRRPVVIPDIYLDPRIPHDAYRSTFVKSLVMVPVRPEEPVAAIGAYWAQPQAATEEAADKLQVLANGASLALTNMQLFQDLQRALEREHAARVEAETANRMKDDFLATLSHELRTPLNVIQGWVWQLRQPGIAPEVLDHAAEVIDRNAALQARLVEDLLDATRAMSGKLTLHRRPVDLVGICRVVAEVAQPTAQARDLALEFRSVPGGLLVHADPDRLQQVVWNVVNNALKFTPPGGRVELSVARADTRAHIQVTDTGVGIPPQVLPHVFERFRQGDPSSTRQHGGLGLGLAITRELVERHGGTVAAHSPGPGGGTTVTIDLPIPAVVEEAGTWLRRRTGTSAGAGARLDGIAVLLVDDEPDALEAVRRILEDCGAQVRVAGSAADALALLSEVTPDVLVTDLAMPGMDGYELLRQVRRAHASSRRIPAAALTAYFGPEHEERARAAGFETFIPKPVGAQELTASLARLAGGRRH
jgi:signal transduction histidine kinase/CheY-like chemotaxis protein